MADKAKIKQLSIKTVDSESSYDTRDIGAEAYNVDVEYDSSGKIISDPSTQTAATTKNLAKVLDDMDTSAGEKAPKVHNSTTSEYGAASATNYGHVKIGAGLNVTDGAVSVKYGTAASTACQGNDSRLSNARKNPNAVTFTDGTTNVAYDGSAAKTITAGDLGAAPKSHASTSAGYGVGTSSQYGHLKIADNLTTTAADTALSTAGAKTLFNAQPADVNYNKDTSLLVLKDASGNTIGSGTIINASDTGVLFLTQAEYDADKEKYDATKAFIVITDTGETDANAITYDNTTSKLSATQVQSAIDEIVAEKADALTFNEDTSQIELRAGGKSGTILSNVTVSTGASDTIRVTTSYETWKLNSNVTVKITNSSGDETFTGHFDITGLYKHAIHFVDTYIITVTDADGKVYTRKKVVKSVDSQLYTIPIEPNIIYGFVINGADSNPASMVSYIEGTDCEGFTPAYMDYTTDTFNYGSWEDAFFMPRPTLLSQDGKVFCYLDPNNYTLDEDGNDVSSYLTGSAGVYNAMMEWGTNDGRRIYYKVVPKDNNSGEVYISDSEVDSDYKCWSFYNWDGNLSEHFYTPIYNGSNVSSVLRSLSGKSILNGTTASTEITYAKANGTGWYTETLADRLLINFLLILMGRSTDTQTTFGNGHYTGGSSASNLLTTGTMNSRGLFYGTNGTGVGVKVFGMENWWGNQWRRIAGWINASGTQKIKLTYGTQDGSSVTGYNTDGTNYISIGATPAGSSGGYTNIMAFNQYGMFNKNAAGSATTYYCDGLWFNNNQTNYALVGGSCNDGLLCGALCANLSVSASYSGWSIGAALSYHG